MNVANAITTQTLFPNPDRQGGILSSSPRKRAHEELRSAINEVIGATFFGPLLKLGRSTNLKGEFGHGGRGEDIFGAQLDSVLAERAGAATQYRLSDALFDRFSRAAVTHEERANS